MPAVSVTTPPLMATEPPSSSSSRPGSEAAHSPRFARSRTQSVSSGRPSTVDHALGLFSPPPTVSPHPEFVAASAAAQIVTDQDKRAGTWYDQNGVEPAPEAAIVEPAALRLVNVFLDQLLFNFLQAAGSAHLSALRPAVSDVLKPKLAKEAIANADDELREYLGSGDEQPDSADAACRDWDLELAWKRTRLRCMVYSSLGDMEEEDEDLYLEQDNLEVRSGEHTTAAISPAAAIFLTSILEYMGELTLTVAGQAAYNRVRAKAERELKEEPPYVADRIVVAETDMEHVAFDRSLGRLWRGWKKRLRSSGTDPAAWPLPTDLSRSGAQSAASQDRRDEPARIPLPLSSNDVEEIEVPGLAYNSDDEDEEKPADADETASRRPKSLSLGSSAMANGLPIPDRSQPESPVLPARKRSKSLPVPDPAQFFISKLLSSDEEQLTKVDRATRREVAVLGPPSTPSGEANGCSRSTSPIVGLLPVVSSPTLAARDTSTGRRDTLTSIRGDMDEDDDVFFETAEIVTSSRVSISGSSASDSGRASTIKRSSSVRSARIVDVPRSPAHSRNASVEATERSRRVTPPSVTSAPRSEGDGRPRAAERSRTEVQSATLRSSLERSRSARPATVSESEPDQDPPLSRRGPEAFETGSLARRAASPEMTSSASFRAAGRTTGSSETVNLTPTGFESASPPGDSWASRGANGQTASKKSPVTRRDRAPAHIRLTSKSPVDNGAGSPRQESSSGWHSPKADARKAKEAEDETAFTSHGTTAPRQIHTSASSASSGTSKLKAVRTSEDNSSRAESVARNFEELIQSNQTITYTLTPENMRDTVSKRSLDGPVVTKLTRKSEDARSQKSPRSSPVMADFPRAALSQNTTSPRTGEAKTPKSPAGSVPRAPLGLAVSTGRATGPQARDARTPVESTADFAEFIKSTGPPTERGPISPRLPKPGASRAAGLDSHPVSVSRNRQQPREPVVDNRTDSSDLIDFIRQGPPILASNVPRIPRHVAPFRSAMESDQLNNGGGMAVDATIPEIRYSQASTNLTDNSMPSMQSSINSNSALLMKAAPAPSLAFDDEAPMPVRKQRRVRDPYAIDFSDEDEDDCDVGTLKPPLKKEESLAEFLRNYEPPPEPESQPAARMPKKKASAPSLIGRLTRRESRDMSGPTRTAPMSKQDSRSLNSRAGGKGGYIPIQVNMPPGYDKYGPVDGLAGMPRVSSTPSAARVPMKRFEPREAAGSKTQTGDLAAFLRDSAPPDGGRVSAVRSASGRTPTRADDGSGLTKMFGRKKKVGAAM
ncbi:hypothetical protein CDD80_6352 [Ophiocordyceps camponoti-rufipedis]|uniref:Flo11 n=1 Tax=Ophiocordyceps camponoti-rufipedis TaxID=2004952 RepID=A0A2C5ZCH7_9HYPO|nr:hypothetical protein CDD80_6352 [Ophiocordyceps camponoti-rufipedis]